ncbi:MAG: pirin family protein [Deltaproteobacteria bacterium]|nr:pirin family protein [Deltaproteobacteria bacterium]
MNGTARAVRRAVRGQPTSDGAGVRLNRVIGTAALADVDPFLMLDEFRSDDASDYIAGFPDHPHRGFETVTYMLEGRMRHHDNQGNSGLLGPGSVQWMTAGRGIVHSEMPEQVDGLMWGFQLWVNLPARDKMTAPRYQDIAPERIPTVAIEPGVSARVIAGSFGGAAGPVQNTTIAPLYLDVALASGRSLEVPVPAAHEGFVYPFVGSVRVGDGDDGTTLARGTAGVLGAGDHVTLSASDGDARLILVAGQPLREPVARYGPFVMTTMDEIRQAILDYQSGRL